MVDGVQAASGAAQSQTPNGEDPKLSKMRSAVRVRCTYAAAFFLFGVGSGIVGYLLHAGKEVAAKDVFFGILPVAAAVVTYWFATRRGGALSGDDIAKIMEAAKPQK